MPGARRRAVVLSFCAEESPVAEKPEERARAEIDRLLAAAGWSVQSMSEANIHASRGVALREFPLKSGHGFADYLLYIDARAAGVIEAKKEGVTLTGVESQSDRYAQGLPEALPAWSRPLPFSYQSTGVETHFTNGLDPEPRARPTFAFHRPARALQARGRYSVSPKRRSHFSRCCVTCHPSSKPACGRRRCARSATSKPR